MKNILKILKTLKKNKIMNWGKYYFIIKLKTKIDVIPRSCFKGIPWDDNFNFVNYDNLIYMKLYSLLILSGIQKH